ncbi:MAG: hypothetical protein IJS22_08410 [Lachnospiraceae bacterium]|nr:hypothetical protein [Lachnospiraceae bacterium]
MSQEKVNAYKESKANRKAEIESARRKKVRNKVIARVVAGVLVVGLAVALVITAVNIVKANQAAKPNYDAEALVIDQYVQPTTDITDLIGTDDDSEVVVNDDGSVTVTGKTDEASEDGSEGASDDAASEEPSSEEAASEEPSSETSGN